MKNSDFARKESNGKSVCVSQEDRRPDDNGDEGSLIAVESCGSSSTRAATAAKNNDKKGVGTSDDFMFFFIEIDHPANGS